MLGMIQLFRLCIFKKGTVLEDLEDVLIVNQIFGGLRKLKKGQIPLR